MLQGILARITQHKAFPLGASGSVEKKEQNADKVFLKNCHAIFHTEVLIGQ